MASFIEQLTVFSSDFSMITAIFVFVAYVVVDMLYAYYTLAVNRLEPGRAATTGSLMYFLLAVGVLNYTNNPLYLFPLVLGSWLGTYVTVEIERRKKVKAVLAP